MSNLTKKEKQALNELFTTLGEKENLLKNIKKSFTIFLAFIFKTKKAKHPSI